VLENRALGDASLKVDLVRDALGLPTRGAELVDAFHRVLTDHRIPEGDERPNAANCVHLESFGTRSSCIVRVANGAAPPRMYVADGPPCVTPYMETSGLWTGQTALGPSAQSRTSGL
jgi:hypothetical protein